MENARLQSAGPCLGAGADMHVLDLIIRGQCCHRQIGGSAVGCFVDLIARFGKDAPGMLLPRRSIDFDDARDGPGTAQHRTAQHRTAQHSTLLPSLARCPFCSTHSVVPSLMHGALDPRSGCNRLHPSPATAAHPCDWNPIHACLTLATLPPGRESPSGTAVLPPTSCRAPGMTCRAISILARVGRLRPPRGETGPGAAGQRSHRSCNPRRRRSPWHCLGDGIRSRNGERNLMRSSCCQGAGPPAWYCRPCTNLQFDQGPGISPAPSNDRSSAQAPQTYTTPQISSSDLFGHGRRASPTSTLSAPPNWTPCALDAASGPTYRLPIGTRSVRSLGVGSAECRLRHDRVASDDRDLQRQALPTTLLLPESPLYLSQATADVVDAALGRRTCVQPRIYLAPCTSRGKKASSRRAAGHNLTINVRALRRRRPPGCHARSARLQGCPPSKRRAGTCIELAISLARRPTRDNSVVLSRNGEEKTCKA
jgi:hypothetical protein